MNEKLKDQDVLLVKEKGKDELKAVKMDKDGKLKRAKPDNGENPDFLKLDKNGNILENFYENFNRQVKNPTQFEFFRIPVEKFKEVFEKLQDAFRHPDKPENNQKQENTLKEAPKTFRKKELSEDQRSRMNEGKTVYIDGLEDKKGKKYCGYITLNKETGKTDFMFPKDYKEALAAGKIIPDDRHKTQVAVNSEGKTNEATKNVKQPLEKGQTKPTEKQAAKQTEKQDTEKTRKSKRIKM